MTTKIMASGLQGVVATTSSISSIINDVLTYRGYHIDDLAYHSDFEEIIHLLWKGTLPTVTELNDLKKELAENAELPEQIIEHMKSYRIDQVHPMAALRASVATLGLFDQEAEDMNEESNYRKAIHLQAKIPTIVAAFSRIREGKEPLKPKTDLSLAGNFLYMLTGTIPNETAQTALNKALVLHADHELNASTFTGRVCVATLSDMYSGITAAIGALKGPLHGGANERVMEMLTEIGEIKNIKPYLQKKFENKEKIMGFGHRVYKTVDPRAKHLREMSKQLAVITGDSKWYEMSIQIEEIIQNEKGLVPNVDFFSASVYHSLGIKHDLFTPIFTISRVSGWIAHILEQYSNNRLIRPRAEYTGEKNKPYLLLNQR